MARWSWESPFFLLALIMFTDAAYNMDLVTLLKHRAASEGRSPGAKRKFDVEKLRNHLEGLHEGNPCNEPEKPFPCRDSSRCIPMGFVCDDNWDCEDGYDEDLEVCTAVHRPPVEKILEFLAAEKDWIMPNLFLQSKTKGKDMELAVRKVAHGLAVSPSVDDFKRLLANIFGLGRKEIKVLNKKLRMALEAVKDDNKEIWKEMFNMPPYAWPNVKVLFDALQENGFN